MASQVQYRRGTNAQNAAFTGALAEITVDTTNGTLRVHDAITVGGSNIATVSYVTSQISALSANSITNGTSSVAVIASGGNIRSNVGGSTITNTYSSGLAVTGLISATGAVTAASVVGGVMTGSSVSATGAVTAASVVGGVMTGSSVSVTGTINGTTLTGTSLTVSTGNITGGNLLLSGALEDSGQLDIRTTASNGNIVLTPNGTGNVNTGANVSVTGNISTASNIVIGSGNSQILNSTVNLEIVNNVSTGNINFRANVNGGGDSNVLRVLGTGGVAFAGNLVSMFANGAVANGVSNIGSASGTFNTIFAKATSAQYADLAEMYVSDQAYAPGTVVEFGGQYEITISSASHSTSVAGIISTNPSYLMNSAQTGEHVLPVALTGRVPCRVQGPVRKGDVLVASVIPGVAQRIGMNWQPGCILGKSMQVIDSAEIQIIEVAVGRT